MFRDNSGSATVLNLPPPDEAKRHHQKNSDAVVITTDHKEFKEIDWTDFGRKMRHRIVVDGRHVVDAEELRENGV